ncbi:hypothetical protein ACU5EH_08850 [Aliivibrio salmonicida]|uniref:hypothetical protein n=1 Tax=Aliivibrio salmonicida TaxID=40269 RepID=UPI00406C9F7F
MKHSKQFYLVKNGYNLEKSLDNFSKETFEHYTLYFNESLISYKIKDGSLFLGDVFSTIEKIESLEPSSFLEQCNHLGGRWVYISNTHIYTDFLASKGVFYTSECNVIASSFGLLRELGEIENKELHADKHYKYNLPPRTEYENVRQLLPGEYIDLEKNKPFSHGCDYFNANEKSEDAVLKEMSLLMENYVESCYPIIAKKGYYQGLTGGIDSRLTLSSFLMAKKKHYSFTHNKPYLFMTDSDQKVPKILSDKYDFEHEMTNKQAVSFNQSDYLEHIGRNADYSIGSNLYYFKSGQMELLKDKFFIDNYYETGARWMLGKGAVGKSSELCFDSFITDGYKTNKKDFDYLKQHIESISDNKLDFKDILYFVKNFSTVGQIFCEMDYYMTPIVHMNSRLFFSEMLSAPESFRENESMLKALINYNIPKLIDIRINKKEPLIKTIGLKLYYKLM